MTPLSRNARTAGALYILASAVGLVPLLYIPSKLYVHGNAAATAANIAAHETLFRLGLVTSLVAAVLWLAVPLALYRLLEGVNRQLAILMVILGSLMQVPLFFVNVAFDAVALQFARGAGFLDGLDQPQRAAFASLFLDLHHHLDLANGFFWGLWLVPFGVLVYRSRFLPRFIGVWLILACVGWLAFSVTGLLYPEYQDKVYALSQPFTLGEVVTMLWLVILGANERRATPSIDAPSAGP